MEKERNNYLTIKEFADLMRVTKDTLIHYDNIGLFKPEYIGNNGYRYYSYEQYYDFTIIKSLRQLNLPLEQILEIARDRKPEEMIEIYEKQIICLEQEMNNLQEIKGFLEYAIDNTWRGMEEYKDGFFQCRCREKRLYNNVCVDDIFYENKNQFLKDSVDWFIREGVNNVDPSATVILTSDAKKRKYTNYVKHYYRVTNQLEQKSMVLYPEGKYLVAYHKGSYETTGDTVQKMLIYANKNNLTVGKYIYEEYLIYELVASDENRHITKILLSLD